MSDPLRGVVVGLRVGRSHAMAMARLKEFELAAVCDLDSATAESLVERTGEVPIYEDYGSMLAEQQPDVVAVCTPTALHYEQTIAAIEAGAKGICCEKPMAVRPADARDMVARAKAADVALMIAHQRRVQPDLRMAKKLIDDGAIGELRLLRGQCAGDLLSDGTHLIDSLLYLAGDPDVRSVIGQLHRDPAGPTPHGSHRPGYRYGHAVESGAMGLLELVNGVRIEIFCGDLRQVERPYQDYEIHGTAGRLWRCGDQLQPCLFISDGQGGETPSQPGPPGPWHAVPDADPIDGRIESYRLFAPMILAGADHPMSARRALRGFEALTAIGESARLSRRLAVPCDQTEYPLDVLLADRLMNGW